MSNSRASLASDYLDNFYASLPPRSSTYLIFWIRAQFFCTKVVNMSYILDLCPILFHQGYQHVLYFGFLPPGRQTTRLSSCTGPHLANQREEQTHIQGPSLTVILHCIAFFPFPTALAFFVSQSLCALIFLALLLILVLFTFLATPFALFLRTL